MARVVRRRGTVGELHARDPFAGGPLDAPVVWWCDPTDVALVLGTRQGVDLVDREACAARGVAVTSRRSGGGAVLVDPARIVWLDAVLPHGVAPDDVRGSMTWLGERLLVALGECGHATGSLSVHDGGMVCGPGSGLVCFAGIGPGEVLDAGRKLVGLSQRRTRHGVRIQALVHTAALQHELRDLLAVDVAELAPIAVSTDLAPRPLADALAATI